MSYLHENEELFGDTVVRTANALGLTTSFVVKDYFIFEMLRSIVGINPSVVFKGGTSLSKCHHVIDRFSEDIDLGLEVEHATEGQRRKMKAMVVGSARRLGLEVSNLYETRSRREFNRYVLPLPTVGDPSMASDTLVVETAVMTPASPAVRREIDSLVGEYLRANGFGDFAVKHRLLPFELSVNSIERTYVDKVYALCDYYLDGAIPARQSRHVYDLYRLQGSIVFDETLAELFAKVGGQRNGLPRCHSAEDGILLSSTLAAIDSSDAYRGDYESVTSRLLYEDVPYDVAREAFPTVIDFLHANGF